METVANFIHGECVTGSGQRVQAIFNPATGEQIRQVVMSTTQETEQAIAAAHDAFPGWARHSPLKTCASDVSALRRCWKKTWRGWLASSAKSMARCSLTQLVS
ncbi:succinate-semialdehyde dehydrogenase [NADP+] [Citrobacter freundii]|nr:succinate-semialdehyde dehydrogenase [NADP+] [Citrobacter freundii]